MQNINIIIIIITIEYKVKLLFNNIVKWINWKILNISLIIESLFQSGKNYKIYL